MNAVTNNLADVLSHPGARLAQRLKICAAITRSM
jgi:hypothetical protein